MRAEGDDVFYVLNKEGEEYAGYKLADGHFEKVARWKGGLKKEDGSYEENFIR